MRISASNAMIAAQTAAQPKPLRLPELSSRKPPQAEAARPSVHAAGQPNPMARPGSQLNILI